MLKVETFILGHEYMNEMVTKPYENFTRLEENIVNVSVEQQYHNISTTPSNNIT